MPAHSSDSKNPFLLQNSDPAVFQAIAEEHQREATGLELIASENYVSSAVLAAQGSILTNKYAEGYPGKRYYGGCVHVDKVEKLAIERICQLFGSPAANVQPHSGSQANMAVYLSVLQPGDKILGMNLSHGGHLTHGSPVNFSGKLFQAVHYGLHPETHRLDYNLIREQALKEKPRLIVAGASAYPRTIDFKAFGEIAQEVGADLMVDMAHIAGLVAVGLHPSPVGIATYTTSTTHKTLRGPRGGFILAAEDKIKKINSTIFPGIQGGPLMHVIAAKAVAFGEALRPEFKTYQKQVIENSQVLAQALTERGLHLVTGGSDNHLVLIDLSQGRFKEITGKDAEGWLDQAGITVNKNAVPFDSRSPQITSGIRMGTPAITSRGIGPDGVRKIAHWFVQTLESKGDAAALKRIQQEVQELCRSHPLPSDR